MSSTINPLTDWKGDVNYDIVNASVPLVAEVYTCNTSGGWCMPGWPYRADHFVTIAQYNPGANPQQTIYNETGNAADTCTTAQPAYAPDAWTGWWTDPTTGTGFNEPKYLRGTTVTYLQNRTVSLIW